MNYLRIADFNNKTADEYSSAYMIQSVKPERDLSEDYVLPDYLPDAKKILKFIVDPVIQTRFQGSSGFEFSGTLYCRALYFAEDSSLRLASFSIPFEEHIPCEDAREDCVDLLDVNVVSALCRLQNPRKLNARIKVEFPLKIWQRSSTLPELYGGTGRESSLQTLVLPVPSMNVISLREDDLSFAEDISVDKTMPDIDRIVLCEAQVFFDQCHASKDQVVCRGNLFLECIYSSSSGENQFFKKVIPVSDSFSCSGADTDCSVFAKCFSRIPEVNISADEFGALRIIELDLSYGVDITLIKEKNVLYTADAFSTLGYADVMSNDIDLYTPCQKISSSFSVSESIEAKDVGVSKEESILACYLTPEMSLQSKGGGKHGKLLFEGDCKALLILSRPDGSIREGELHIPIKYESDHPFREDAFYECSGICRASLSRIRFDSEQIFFDFEVMISFDVLSRQRINAVNCIRILPESPKERESASTITLYYPSPSESIWDVAKKYGVTRERIASENSISSSELPPVIKI